jgi:hypothetical protein
MNGSDFIVKAQGEVDIYLGTSALTPGDYISWILTDPATSYWLKNALKAALKRDPVDVANDAEHLASLLSVLSKLRIEALEDALAS